MQICKMSRHLTLWDICELITKFVISRVVDMFYKTPSAPLNSLLQVKHGPPTDACSILCSDFSRPSFRPSSNSAGQQLFYHRRLSPAVSHVTIASGKRLEIAGRLTKRQSP